MAIRDHGVGIDPNRLESLFDFNHNYSTDGTLGEKGTGLGMPIMKRYADALNISVSVKSRIDDQTGTRFSLKWVGKSQVTS